MMRRTVVALFVFLFSASTALAQIGSECKKYRVSFQSIPKEFPTGVYHGGSKIGDVVSGEMLAGNSIDICIDKKFSGLIEHNSVCYLSEKSLIVYNVWSSGKDLPENSTMPGFSSELSLFVHEIKLIFNSIKN